MKYEEIERSQTAPTRYWHIVENGRVQCDLCPRFCQLKEGQRGLCYVRANQNNKIVLTSYGRSSGFCVDPIEKKPLNHFLPGSAVFSFGTAGCNLSCKFCQNWDISKSRQMDTLADQASPQQIAIAAQNSGCSSVAFTYNDPVIFHEYAIDVAQACEALNIKTVAVSAGYVCAEPRAEFYRYMDAANIDLKAFTDTFYHQLTGSHLQPVLDTLVYLKHETNVWLEITTLLIPGQNDLEEEIEQMTQWIFNHLGNEVPLHFSAFHPDYKMRNIERTSTKILTRARTIALKNGLKYVYTGNVVDIKGQSTYCSNCSNLIIGRDQYQITDWLLKGQGICQHCGNLCPGVFEPEPGQWGSKRLPIQMNR